MRRIPIEQFKKRYGDSIVANLPQPVKKPGYLQRVGQSLKSTFSGLRSDLETQAQTVAEADLQPQDTFKQRTKSLAQGATALARGGLRTVGATAQAAFTPILEAPGIKQATEAVGGRLAATTPMQKFNVWAQRHPEAAKDIVNTIDVVALFGGKGATSSVTRGARTTTGRALIRAGESVERSAEKAAVSQQDAFLRNLVKPALNKKERLAEVGRTTETGKGLFKRSVIEPTTRELRSVEALKGISELSERKTYQQNFNIVDDAITKEAESLTSALQKNDFIFPKKELLARIQAMKQKIAENPSLVGSNEQAATKLIAGFERMLAQSEAKGSSLLQLRKDYDAWVRSQKGSKVFDPNTENAFSMVNRELRQTVNDFLEAKAIDVGVKDSLAKQSAMYNALDVIRTKAADEANSAIMRGFQKMAQAVGVRNRLAQQLLAPLGIAGFGSAALFAPYAAAVGVPAFAIWQGSKLIMRADIRKAAGQLLQRAGRVLTPAERRVIENATKGRSITEGLTRKTKENPLFQEARKYKSAEEFVKAQGKPLFSGSSKASIVEKEGFKKVPFETGVPAFGEGTYLTTSRSTAKGFGDVVNAYIPNNLKLFKATDADAYRLKAQDLLKRGYDGVELTTGTGKQITIFDPSQIKTKSQLTDIWNKAQGTDLISEARKYKTAEEFVKAQGTPVYHVTSSESAKSIAESGFKAQIGERSIGVANARGVWVYESKTPTTEFSKNFKNPATVEANIQGKIFDAMNDDRSIRALVEDKKLIAKLKADGYVAIRGSEMDIPATFVFDESAIKTRSQLTDIWNQARKGIKE